MIILQHSPLNERKKGQESSFYKDISSFYIFVTVSQVKPGFPPLHLVQIVVGIFRKRYRGSYSFNGFKQTSDDVSLFVCLFCWFVCLVLRDEIRGSTLFDRSTCLRRERSGDGRNLSSPSILGLKVI